MVPPEMLPLAFRLLYYNQGSSGKSVECAYQELILIIIQELLDEAQLLYDILSSLPQERLMESVREKLLHAPDDLRRARECIAQQLRGVRNADRAERGLAPATDADDTGSDASSDEGYIDVFLTELDHAEHPVSAKQPEPAAQPEPTEQPELAEQSEPANQPEPAEEPSAENDEATRLTPEPPTAQGPSSQS